MIANPRGRIEKLVSQLVDKESGCVGKSGTPASHVRISDLEAYSTILNTFRKRRVSV